jgi:hypothetical protein
VAVLSLEESALKRKEPPKLDGMALLSVPLAILSMKLLAANSRGQLHPARHRFVSIP